MSRTAQVVTTIAIMIALSILFACFCWQRYIHSEVSERYQQKQMAYIAKWLPVAVQAQKKSRTGQQVIDNCLQYGGLSPANKEALEQQYQTALAQTHSAR